VWLRFVVGLEKGHDVEGWSGKGFEVVGPTWGHRWWFAKTVIFFSKLLIQSV